MVSPPCVHLNVLTSCVNCAENNNFNVVPMPGRMTAVSTDSQFKGHRHANQGFSLAIGLRRTCTICRRKVYFNSLRCDLCNSVAHRRCLNQKIDINGSEFIDSIQVSGSDQLTSKTPLADCKTWRVDNDEQRPQSKSHQLSKSHVCFYSRFLHWMTRRIKSPKHLSVPKNSADCGLCKCKVDESDNCEPKREGQSFCSPMGQGLIVKMHVHSTAFLNTNRNPSIAVEEIETFQKNSRDIENVTDGQFGWPVRKTRTFSVESKTSNQESLCATWPPVGRKVFNSKEDNMEGSESGFEDYDPEEDVMGEVAPTTDIKDTMGEWSIPFEDLKIGRKVRTGRRHDIYRGRWHGEVMIHIFHINSASETAHFWKEVSSMSMIRHENLALFMGVCIDMPQLAIVTSVRKARSLYDHIHVKKDHCPLPTKVHIARQVAQGMSYLHAKGITHRKLNSKNILLESKVKVCLLDQGMAEQQLDRLGYGCIPNGHLTYISPEIMRSLVVQPPKLVNTVTYTESSDVYAFGTVLYELFGEQWPFQGQLSHSIVWQVGSGQVQSLDAVQCSSGLKNLISECWTPEASCRPTFCHILRVVQDNVVLHRRHSSSEPENLNRLGFNPGLLR